MTQYGIVGVEVTGMNVTQVSVAEAKLHFADLLGRVAYGKEHVTITRRGRPMVVLVPPEEVRRGGHLAEAKGWLDDYDAFFRTMAGVVEHRRRHHPRRPFR